MVGMAGAEGGGATLTAATGTLLAATFSSAIPSAIAGSGGNVGTGGSAAKGAKVGQGVGVGQGAGDGGEVGVTSSARALAISRRATMSQATTRLVKLKAMTVALNPLPILLVWRF
jgi:hypothetical protein